MYNIDSQIEILEKHIRRDEERGKFENGFFWILIRGHSLTKNKTAKTTITDSSDIVEFEESIDLLKEEIEAAASAGESRMHIRFYSNERMTQEVAVKKITIKESRSSSLTGFGGGNNAMIGSLFSANIEQMKEVRKIEKTFSDKENARVIAELKAELEAERENKKSTFQQISESISGYVKTPEGIGQVMETIQSLTGLVQMFKSPSGAMAGFGDGTGTAAAAAAQELDSNSLKWLSIKEQLEKHYNGDVIQLGAILGFYAEHEKEQFSGIIQRMAIECENYKNG